ncbi:acylphosphatase-2-like isoform X2 [Perca flavescens]|uniref:acylphosphatase-2-like isoform X2 n=1 Tax=Perca flavescens TaxID=8167 RepID=UPI00106EE182|nr:acylphosphatase-2-like isoform X2 [Perca flavescens]
MSEGEPAGTRLVSLDFEIFGYVQGVCFRMYTEKEGKRLGLVGWVRNTPGGSVEGQVQGPAHMVDQILSLPPSLSLSPPPSSLPDESPPLT